jgi:hypothetical protein
MRKVQDLSYGCFCKSRAPRGSYKRIRFLAIENRYKVS